ncbi:hypothetical protein BB558_003582 [Smittium angustum]|uniref:Peptidase A1 domain-containing protein n=1 Tax=Smittium angustum TaxID=133377 RepID=A0A2U1J5J9_SMIAN|nr:hypothetical protein BB558_003582 [Smittium angustum]
MIFKTISLAAFTFQFMNLGVAAPNQSVAIPVNNFQKTNELFKRTSSKDQKNEKVDIDMIKGDNGYYVELGVGNPQQNLRFQIDTESYIQFIASDKCDSCFYYPENRRMFTGIDTESFTDSDFFKLNESGISSGGYLLREPLCLKEGISEYIKFAALNTTTATVVTVEGYDGVIGIGYPKRYDYQENIKLRNFFIEKFLENDRIISINLKPVIVNPLYRYTYLQWYQVRAIDKIIEKSYNCMDIHTLPTVAFTIGDNVLTLEPKDYITFRYGICVSNIAKINSDIFGDDHIILGQNFLEKYAVTFDYDYGRIGFTE